MSYKVQKPCRICGKMYTPCPDCESDNSAFHWRTVACSIECGREYFRRIMESRNAKTVPNNITDSHFDIDKDTVKNNETESRPNLNINNVQTKSKNSLKKTDSKKSKEESEQIG